MRHEQCQRLAPDERLITDLAGQLFGLLDPILDLGLRWRPADPLFGLVGFDQLGIQVGRHPLGQLDDGVHTGCFEQVRVLFADPFDAKEVNVVDPAKNE